MTNTTEPTIAMSVAEAAKAAGISRTTIYALINGKELAIVRLGARTLVLRADLEAYLHSKRVACPSQARNRPPYARCRPQAQLRSPR